MKDRVRLDRNAIFEVRAPESFFVNDLPVVDDRNRCSGRIRPIPRTKEFIDRLVAVEFRGGSGLFIRRRLSGNGRGDGGEQQAEETGQPWQR